MGAPYQITVECSDAEQMARFWALALEYEPEAPPPGYLSWSDYLRSRQLALPHAVRAIVDPTGRGPRILFIHTDSPSPARLHLDVRTRSGDARRARVDDLLAAGGNKVRRIDEHDDWWIVIADPDGNEFCVT